jgi:uncharacterized RmlC-like cupin family protein
MSDGIFVIRGGGNTRNWNGIEYRAGLSAKNTAAQQLSMNVATIPPNTAGDFIFIEPGVPHEVFNMSDTEPVVAVVARSDASEWEHIVPYDRQGRGARV